MKKIFLTCICFFAALGLRAQEADGIRIRNLSVVESDGTVHVSYRALISPKAVKRNHILVFAPVITDGTYRQSLPAVIVEGRGARTVRARQRWASGAPGAPEPVYYTGNGKSIDVFETVPAQEWMDGSQLLMESILFGCCEYNRLNDRLWAERLDLGKPPVSAPAPVSTDQWIPVTLADSLSTAFTFVVPMSEFDENEPFRIYDDERENSLVVYFRVGKYDIDSDYMGNRLTLNNLNSAISMILRAEDSRVNRVIVAGFASPEGSYELNNRLAFERAVSVKQQIIQATGIADSRIMVYNGSVDWRGLRAMVARSYLPEKNQILDIIDHAPILDTGGSPGRLSRLMQLNGGSTYRYLLNEYFPYLRNGAFIKVYYENQ